MRFDILTLFPAMFEGPLTESILKRAQAAGLISIGLHNIRDYATDRHHTTDDAPYGGGAGMVMKPAPLAAAIRAVTRQSAVGSQQSAGGSAAEDSGQPLIVDRLSSTDSHSSLDSDHRPPTTDHRPPTTVILLSPDGEPFTQALAEELAQQPWLVLVCGHYEGVDERVREALIDREITIGDYVLTGGELAAMVVVDAVARLVPEVLDAQSTAEESHSDSLLEYPHYTRPAVWEDRAVPPVLLSGHHGEVAKWRRHQRLHRTLRRRPDLLARAELSDTDQTYLAALREDERRRTKDEGSETIQLADEQTKAMIKA